MTLPISRSTRPSNNQNLINGHRYKFNLNHNVYYQGRIHYQNKKELTIELEPHGDYISLFKNNISWATKIP